MEIVEIAGHMVGKATFEPGWKWSNHVKPIALSAGLLAMPPLMQQH